MNTCEKTGHCWNTLYDDGTLRMHSHDICCFCNKKKDEMTNEEILDFLKKKPTYSCRFHPTDWWHEVGCPHKEWTKEELQRALDNAKRSIELQIYQKNNPTC